MMNRNNVMNFCIIRHGETVYNIEERMQGVRNIELSERGVKEAVLLGGKLREEGVSPERIFSSPVKRAFETAENLGFNVPVIPFSEFRSRSLGDLEGLTKSEIRIRFPGAIENLILWDFLPPGGDETLRHMFDRGNSGVEKILAEGKNVGDIVIVTHSGVLEALIRGWLDLKPLDPLPFPLKNAGAIFFERVQETWRAKKMVSVGEGDFLDHS